jgi:hypothetical protein
MKQQPPKKMHNKNCDGLLWVRICTAAWQITGASQLLVAYMLILFLLPTKQ